MEKITINPEDYKEAYIENLNACFNGWGGEKEYEWGFKRRVGELPSDIMLIENAEDGVIAGSAVSYRMLSWKTDSFDIGIMTGSWTLPAARKKGCFTKMIHSSRDLCEEKNVPFLTAFVTAVNPSSRRLETEGSYMLPTWHLFSPEILFDKEDGIIAEILNHDERIYHSIYDIVQERQSGFLNFSYNYKEFVDQYLERIKKTTILRILDDFAILEDGVNEVKVLLLTYSDKESLERIVTAVTNWCLTNKSSKAFFFSTRPEFKEVCENLNFQIAPGYFTILKSFDDKVDYEKRFENLNINMADKM